jgi:hypothetical protein
MKIIYLMKMMIDLMKMMMVNEKEAITTMVIASFNSLFSLLLALLSADS